MCITVSIVPTIRCANVIRRILYVKEWILFYVYSLGKTNIFRPRYETFMKSQILR